MRLIVTHEQPDFDALASLALAKLLFPGAEATVQGGIGPSQQGFLKLYRDVLDLLDADDIDLDQVSELIVVDTADRTRIRPFDALIGRVPVTLYDHHPLPDDAIPAGRGITERVGATATLLTRELAATSTPIPAAIASLGLLGIHEDTGNLSYDMTTPDDYRAGAYLLANGANLALARRFAHDSLSPEQQELNTTLHANARTTTVAGRQVVTAAFEYPLYVSGVSGLVSDLLEIHGSEAAMVAVRMDGKTLVIARSNERFDSAAALAEAIGGAGHPGAAFGKTDLDPEQALHAAIASLARHATPLPTAGEIMTRAVKTVRDHASVAETQAELLLHGHNGMPVLDRHGEVVGIISRRDIDRALRHGLGRSRVSGFMSRAVVTAGEAATVPELEELVLNHNIGRIPITRARPEGGAELVGIVTRADLISARHRPESAPGEVAELISRLPPRAREVVSQTQRLAGDARLYLVGGTVRDLLIGAGSKDIDLVVEGDQAERLAGRLQQNLGGTLAAHVDFGTSTLALEDGPTIDIATAREEVYAHPGALPEVSPSSLRQDLARRDFTVNAIALRLQPEPQELIDPYGGRRDLVRKQLRILHPLSFVEDPTRLLRGARLAGRLAFDFAADTANKARAALEEGVTERVSRSRLRAELELTLSEQRVAPAIELLESLGALRQMFGLSLAGGLLELDALALIRGLDELRRTTAVPDEAYLLTLLLDLDRGSSQADTLPPDDAGAPAADPALTHVELFNWPRRLLHSVDKLRRLLAPAENGGSEHVTDDELERLTEAEGDVVRVASPTLSARLLRLQEAPARRKLRGRDVVALGLPEGPAVGEVLAEVARSRAAGETDSFEDELTLAQRLVDRKRTSLGSPE